MTAWTIPGYTASRELGSGAAGTVVLATHDETGVAVAIKYLATELFEAPGFRDRFRAEARLLAELDAPNVVRLYEYVETTAGAAIVMELVDGVSLRAMLTEHGPTAPEAALCVLKGSLLGLCATHAAGVVHRDYKPDNVLVTADGESKLTDFGIAGRSGEGGTRTGTPEYMAPEQWSGAAASPPADIYAATATFVECLTGAPPYVADDHALLRRQHERAAIPVHGLPSPVRDLARRGLAKHPRRRPADAAAFLAALESAAAGGYGAAWEERGRRRLAEGAALLAALFPLTGGTGVAGGTAIAHTTLGGRLARALSGSGQASVAAVAIATLVVGGGAAVLTGIDDAPEPDRAALATTEVDPFAGPDTRPPAADPPDGAQPPDAPQPDQPALPSDPVDRPPPEQGPDSPTDSAGSATAATQATDDGGSDVPPPDDGGSDVPPDDGGSDVPPPDDGGSDVPPDDGGSDAPPDDGGSDAPPPDDGGSDAPPDDGGSDVPPPDDGCLVGGTLEYAGWVGGELIDLVVN
jgi:eukaryotic-like serine/threonine-protein kinase